MSTNPITDLVYLQKEIDEIAKNKPIIRFQLTGEHVNENKVIGNMAGYKMMGLLMLKGVAGAKSGDGNLTIDLNRFSAFRPSEEDIGFDEFVVDENCEITKDDLIHKDSRKNIGWIVVPVVSLIMFVIIFIMYKGVLAIWHGM